MPRGRPRSGSGLTTTRVKGAKSAYACFVKTCREEHKKLHPDENVQFAEFSAQCSQRWQTMLEKEKEKFHEMALEDKERYAEEMKDFIPSPARPRRRRARGSRKDRDPNKPKRALSAFFYYAKDERVNVRGVNPDFSVGEVAKELGRQWNELTVDVKAPYEKLAEDDRARYDRDMKVYRSGGDMTLIIAAAAAAAAQQSNKKLKASNGHPVPVPVHEPEGECEEEDEEEEEEEAEPEADVALCAFFYYAKDERANVRSANPDFTVDEVAKELSRQWNELTVDMKAHYEKLDEDDRARYDRGMKK